ncbi:MAG: hypothetical protein GY874_07630 [Desulfobacteraceae bacterium]|nr:hypothetical protein [Desulfobacteraceae bacterium]
MGKESEIQLDPEAWQRFSFPGRTKSRVKTRKDLIAPECLAQGILKEQMRHDQVRIMLIQLTYLISRYLANGNFTHKAQKENQVFGHIAYVLEKLGETPGNLASVFIRYRGTPPDSNLHEKYDYEVITGNIIVDAYSAMRVVSRCGSKYAKLPELLVEAFTVMAGYGVNNIFIRLAGHLEKQMPLLHISLKILAGFRQSRQTGSPIVIDADQKNKAIPLVYDENLLPDPNLTLIAGLNRFSAENMEKMVKKASIWLRQKTNATAIKKYPGVYNAALGLPELGGRWTRPPLELNNIKWLLTDAQKKQVITKEKVYIARLAMESANAAPQTVAKMIHSVYGDDYSKIDTHVLGERLHLCSRLLQAAEQSKKRTGIEKELLGKLKNRLDQVKDNVFDNLQVVEDKGQERAEHKDCQKIIHSQIYSLVYFYKDRSATRKKMAAMMHRPIRFTPQDYSIIARDFRIPVNESEELIRRLKSCFTKDGRFIRKMFHDVSIVFRSYENKIFHFLWHHMKNAIFPEDKVCFLNALQSLTVSMKQPQRALKILIEDICENPEKLQFSDNKAVMLANRIIRQPEKALADFQTTPEDIVMNRHNLNKVVIKYASWRIEKEKEIFLTKFDTIHKKLIEALRIGETSEQHIPASVMLNLEREFFIFLTLVQSDTSKAIIRSAVNEYGDPGAGIYYLDKSQNLMGGLIQNLMIGIRALGALGTISDVALLERIKEQEENFQRIKKDPLHRAQTRKISQWTDEAIKIIKFRQ